MPTPDSHQPRDQVGFDHLRPAEDHPARDSFPPLDEAPPNEPPWVTAARKQAHKGQHANTAQTADGPEALAETEDTPPDYDRFDEDDLAPGGDAGGNEGRPSDGADGDPSDGADGGDDDGGSSDPPTDDGHPGGAMGLLDHLGELRSVLMHSGLAALAAAVICWFWSEELLAILVLPIKEQGVYFTAPNEAFLTRLKLSGIVGLFVVAPFIFFRIYGFVLPGLYSREKRVVTPLLIVTTILFYVGVAFAFLIVIPQVVRFLLSFGTEAMEPLIGVGKYFAFVARLCLAFGLVFELPLLVLLLSSLGIVNPRMLLRTWRFAILIIAAMSALLTPPDIISQLMMAGPVLVLYLGSVLVAMLVVKRKRNED